MFDEFEGHSTSLTSPATRAEVVVPNDTEDLGHATRGLYVGNAGNIRVKMVSGDVVTLENVQSGVTYPLRVAQVLASGTTASGLIGLR